MPLINFSGLASGIDSEALIDATREARRAVRVVPNETEIAELEDTNSALEEFKTLLLSLKDLAADFRTLAGGGISKNVTSSNETILSAVASTSANPGTYTVTVDQLATNATFSFNASITSPSATVLATSESGNISFDVGTGDDLQSISIDIDDDDTYSDIEAKINAASTRVTASIVQVDTDDYRLVITTNEVGTAKGSINNMSVTGDLAPILDDSDVTHDTAQNAQVHLSGVASTIVRSSNTINDLIPGVTLNLEDADSGTPVTIKVGVDTSSTESTIQAFIDKYNEIVEFVAENNQITREENGEDVTNIFSPLADTRIDDGALSAIRSALSSSSYTVDADDDGANENLVRIFADLGISTERDGTLKFDSDKFQESLADEPDSVQSILELFGDTVAVTGGTIDQYTRFNGLIDTTLTSNTDRISDLNERISSAETAIEREMEQIRSRFARLEATISELQASQNALTQALAGLGTR
ncbi:MAG: flagellar filament capping protein FliD [Bdellovibrionales bacterium]|nr:flagellar filament capping protein FliD [Bdellovibrionales bacterium]